MLTNRPVVLVQQSLSMSFIFIESRHALRRRAIIEDKLLSCISDVQLQKRKGLNGMRDSTTAATLMSINIGETTRQRPMRNRAKGSQEKKQTPKKQLLMTERNEQYE